MTGIQNLLDRFNNGFNRNLGYNNLHLHLGQQGYVNLSAAVILGSALLYAAADYVGHSHAGYADGCQCFLQNLKLGLLCNDNDLAELMLVRSALGRHLGDRNSLLDCYRDGILDLCSSFASLGAQYVRNDRHKVCVCGGQAVLRLIQTHDLLSLAYAQADGVLDDVEYDGHGDRNPCNDCDNAEDLEWREREMRKLLISQDLNIVSCSFREEQGFLSSLPLTNPEKHLYERSKRNVLTSGAASCYPFVSYSICDDNGILFGVNKHNNSLVIADIFDSRQYKNSNICILGCSGAGKTFTMQTMALRMRRKGIQVFIIAPLKGHEFYRAARNVGGEFIQISPASKNCINIMEIRKVDNSVNELLDGPTLDASALAGKIQRLHIFFSLLIPDMSHEEKQLLDEALIKTYALKGITHKNESLTDPQHPEQYKKMPILEDVYNVLLESEDTKRLAHILNRLVHGSAFSFNQQTNVDLTNKYTVLDISELTGSSDLLTVGMFVALDYVWDKAKENRTEEKAIFVDEVWQLIGASSNRLAAEFVLEIAKIIRAYSGAGIFATQDLNDFFALDDGKYGKGIINNCKTKIILNMEDEEAQRVKTILHLSETEVMNITHFQRGNGLISTNNNNITVEFKASNLEKELITTDRQELLEILAKQKKQAV